MYRLEKNLIDFIFDLSHLRFYMYIQFGTQHHAIDAKDNLKVHSNWRAAIPRVRFVTSVVVGLCHVSTRNY